MKSDNNPSPAPFSLSRFFWTIMTSDSADNKDKKEAAGFFSRWMSSDSKGDGWDEVCLQWCKQKSAARTENADPNCSMLCFKRPVSADAVDANEKWNPLKGYTVSVVNGKNECADHTSGKFHSSNRPLDCAWNGVLNTHCWLLRHVCNKPAFTIRVRIDSAIMYAASDS